MEKEEESDEEDGGDDDGGRVIATERTRDRHGGERG